MEVKLLSGNEEIIVEAEMNSTVRQVLDLAKIHPSTVIVSFEQTVLPHATILKGDITLDLTIVSSGG